MPDYTSFVFLDDDEKFPYLPEDTGRGYRVARYGLIQAADPIKALQHPSVPQRGERLAEDLYMTVTTRKVVETMGGRRGEGSGPIYKLEIVYETPNWSGAGSLRPAAPGDSWTEVSFGTAALTVYDEVGLEQPPGLTAPPLNNGDGMSRDVGVVEAIVKAWYSDSQFRQLDHARLVRLSAGYVNEESITLPNLMGSGFNFVLGPRQVRYVSPEYVREGEFFGVVHHLKLAPDWYAREVVKDANGMVAGILLRQLYEPTDLSGLW